jgi:GH24 family phage-related lysozyme (muramidase)
MQRYADEVGKWIRAGGKVLPNLVRRRAAEVALDEKP